MIGNLYFVVKSTVITFVIVCLLQIQFSNRTLEDRLMTYVRTSLAPQVLGRDTSQVDHSKYKLSPTEIAGLRKRIFESEALKGVRNSAKAVFMREMEDVMKKKLEAEKASAGKETNQ